MSIYIAGHNRAVPLMRSMRRILLKRVRLPSTGDRSWRCWVLDHAGRCSVRSRRSDQSQRTHDGLTCWAVFLARRVGGGWPNEGAVVQWPAYTALIVIWRSIQCLNYPFCYRPMFGWQRRATQTYPLLLLVLELFDPEQQSVARPTFSGDLVTLSTEMFSSVGGTWINTSNSSISCRTSRPFDPIMNRWRSMATGTSSVTGTNAWVKVTHTTRSSTKGKHHCTYEKVKHTQIQQ